MKKKILAMVMAVVMVIGVVPIATVSAETSGDWEYRVDSDGNATITGYDGNGGAITIPDKLDGKAVIGIGDGAFEGCTNLTSITIPT